MGNTTKLMDDPLIRKNFPEDLNPGLDLNSLYIRDQYKTFINYRKPDGTIGQTTVFRFVCNVRKNGFFDESKLRHYAWEYKEFRDFFDPKVNPGVDPTKLMKSDDRKIQYIGEDGLLCRISVNGYFLNLQKHNGHFVPSSNRGILAYDFKEFRDWFDVHLNPDVDLNRLSRTDIQIYLKYKDEGGIVRSVTARQFFHDIKTKGYFAGGGVAFAKDQKVFMDWFDQALNPDIDLDKLFVSSDKSFVFIDDKNKKRHLTLIAFFTNVKKHNGKFDPHSHKTSSRKALMAKDSPIFMDWFEEDLNRDVSLDRLRQTDRSHYLAYHRPDGSVDYIVCSAFFKNIDENGGCFVAPAECYQRHSFTSAWDSEEFRRWFDPKLNPDIHPETLKRSDSTVVFKYRDAEDSVNEISVLGFFSNIKKHHGRFIIPAKVSSVMEDPEFKEWYGLHCKGLNDDDKIAACSYGAATVVHYRDDEDHIRQIRISSWFNNKRINGHYMAPTVFMHDPYRSEASTGVNDAETMDPELAAYWDPDNEKDLSEIYYLSPEEFKFICPFCGHHFVRAMRLMACKSLKCPNCLDGTKQIDHSDRPANIIFTNDVQDDGDDD